MFEKIIQLALVSSRINTVLLVCFVNPKFHTLLVLPVVFVDPNESVLIVLTGESCVLSSDIESLKAAKEAALTVPYPILLESKVA